MPNLKEVKTRIGSVQSTQQITRAMKMVSAAKLRKAQNHALAAAHALRHAHAIMQQIMQGVEENKESTQATALEQSLPWLELRKINQEIVILVTSDKGLCGVFNSAVCKAALAHIQQADIASQAIGFGKRGVAFLRRQKIPLCQTAQDTPWDTEDFFSTLSYATLSQVANELMQRFVQNKDMRITLIYNDARGATSTLRRVQWLPLDLDEIDQPNPHADSAPTRNQSLYLYEPTAPVLAQQVIPLYCRLRLYAAVRSSLAAEHNARMIAMDTATENAAELLKELRLHYNRTRQAVITQEILEIVGGATPRQ